MKIVEKNPKEPWRPKVSRVAVVVDSVWASEEVLTLSEEKQKSKALGLVLDALDVLYGIHQRKMAGRLAHWLTTCRMDGCTKQPRSSKGHQHSFVFCPGHAGVRNQISKRDYERLKNANLRVVAQ